MENQVLSIEQMKRLIELGVNTSKASLFWCVVETKGCLPFLILTDRVDCLELVPTFTLQDMLAIMPKEIEFKVDRYRKPVDCTLQIDAASDCIYYEYTAWGEFECAKYFGDSDNLLEAVYYMLSWLAEHKYLK
mgnify:CR=1 FL=1